MAGGSSRPAGGMWRAAPAKAAKISRGELSQYRSKASMNGGGRPLAIACAIRLACSSVGEDFGWARLIEVPPRILYNDSRELVSFLSEPAISTHKIRTLGVGRGIIRPDGLSCNLARNGKCPWHMPGDRRCLNGGTLDYFAMAAIRWFAFPWSSSCRAMNCA